MFDPVDWDSIFTPDTPLLEIIVRGSLMYLMIFGLLRLVLKREAGNIGITDLLVTVLIADAAQNAMADSYHSIPDGILLVAVIIFWSFALDWLAVRNKWFRRFVHPKPKMLIRDGKVIHRNMRAEQLTLEELKGLLREQQIENVTEVKEARMESDGHVSVIPFEK